MTVREKSEFPIFLHTLLFLAIYSLFIKGFRSNVYVIIPHDSFSICMGHIKNRNIFKRFVLQSRNLRL